MHQRIIYLVWPVALSCVLTHQHHRPQDTPITILTCIVLVSSLFNKERTVPFGCGCACVLHVAYCIFVFVLLRNHKPHATLQPSCSVLVLRVCETVTAACTVQSTVGSARWKDGRRGKFSDWSGV